MHVDHGMMGPAYEVDKNQFTNLQLETATLTKKIESKKKELDAALLERDVKKFQVGMVE